MKMQQNHFSKLNALIVAGAIGGLSLLAATSSSAAPFTTNLVALSEALTAESTTLSNTNTKAAAAENKVIAKDLALLAKPAVSELVDIKNTATIVKSLLKYGSAAEAYFGPAVEDAISGFENDAQTLIDETQTSIDALSASSCKTKAQDTLNLASAALTSAESSSLSKLPTLLTTAFKDAAKAQADTLSKACSGE